MRRADIVRQLQRDRKRLTQELGEIDSVLDILEKKSESRPASTKRKKTQPTSNRKPLRRHISKTCVHCKKAFKARMNNAIYCSAACCSLAWAKKNPSGKANSPTTGPFSKTLLHGDALSKR